MKKCINILLVTLLSMSALVSCKKNSTSKDYSLSIKEKTWWGVLAYAGQPSQYYSVHFNTDNSLLWSQMSGDYPGQWLISDNHITVLLTGSNVPITADISDADTLMNIASKTSVYVINSGKLVANLPTTLDNTSWSGTFIISGVTNSLKMDFMPGTKVKVTIGASVFSPITYTLSAAGGTVQFPIGAASYLFGVIVSGTQMKGNEANPANQWQTTKQ